ncbi:MAG: hypothetical protein Q9184_007712, partial [Pyrenodesmia sp. 2 TL-2023]
MPAQINTDGLTHLYFSHVDLNRDNFSIVPAHPGDVTLYHDFVTLKTSSMQIWVAVGGREFNSEIWKLMTSRNDWRRMFITSIADFMKHYGFQGVDLSWQFPSAPNEAASFVALVREMRNSWAKQYGISVTIPPSPQYLGGFDLKGMEPYVDFFGYMSWDIQGLAQMTIRAHTDMAVIQNDTTALWAAHLDPHKINFGLANYGHGYTLHDTNCHTAGCPFTGLSKPAPCTNAVGFMSETEINALIKDKSLKPAFADFMAKQITWDDQWIGYDDDETRAQKIAWATQNCFGGTITWSVDLASGEGSRSGSTPEVVGVPNGPGSSSPSGTLKPANQPGQSTAVNTPGTSISSTNPAQSSRPDQSNAPSSGPAITSQRTAAVVSVPASSSISSTNSGITFSPKGSTQSSQSSSSAPSSLANKPSQSGFSGQANLQSSIIITTIRGTLIAATLAVGSSTQFDLSGGSAQSISSSRPGQSGASGQSSMRYSVIVTTISGTPTTTTGVITSGASFGSSGLSGSSGQSSTSGQPQGTTRPSELTKSSTTGKASAAAQTTIPSPTIAAGSMVTEGATAVLGLIPLAKAVQKGMDKAQKAITTLSQANPPNVDDVNGVLGVLAGAYTVLTLLEKEAGMINTNSLPADIKKVIENIQGALPKINKGTSDTIDDLKNSVKDPKKVNKDDLRKADQLLGKQGSITGQVPQALTPLTDWKPPKGNDDIILRGILTIPSPSIGDNWKGTTISGTLTVPSPTLHWDQNIMDDHGDSGSNSGNGGGNGGGGGGFFSGLLNLAKQAEGAVNGAANALTHLSGLSDISFSD